MLYNIRYISFSGVYFNSLGVILPTNMSRRASPGYNLAVLHPEVAKQWHPTKNGDLTPEDVTHGSHKKVWWICDKDHEWETMVRYRTNGSGCHECAGRYASPEFNLAVLYPEVAAQWHPTKNGDLTPEDVAPGSNQKVWWICDKDHEWDADKNQVK